MNKVALISVIFFSFGILAQSDVVDNHEQAQQEKRQVQIQFNRDNAIFFLRQGLEALSQNLSLLQSLMVEAEPGNGEYQMQPAVFEFFAGQEPFHDTRRNCSLLIETLIKTLEDNEEASLEYQKGTQELFDTIIFLISHVRWNMCEIQYDAYRSTVGYHQKIDKAVIDLYAVEYADSENIAYSVFHKGKFAVLCPQNVTLAPLVRVVQYEELSRLYQLNNTLQAYIAHFYRIFGKNDQTETLLQNVLNDVLQRFQAHNMRFILDHELRFAHNNG